MATTSLPVPSSTLSYWHQTTRSYPHLNANSTAKVPASAKYVIIGSGISGALTAWKLINAAGVDGKDVLILEAREAVSGATGRNAGHVRPDPFIGFPRFNSIHGPDQARKVIEHEAVVLKNVKDFVESHNVDCDFNYTTTFDVCLTEDYAAYLKKAREDFHAAGGDTSQVVYHEREGAKAATGVPGTICAYEWPAGSNHPGKLCQWILSDVIRKGGKLWTHCPATKVMKHNDQKDYRWDVYTPRGIVATETLVHCTNAYAAYLLPELAGIVTGRRAQGHSYVPPMELAGENARKKTMALRYGPKHYFTFNQLLNGTVVLGGWATRSDKEAGQDWHQNRITFDDTTHNEYMKKNSIAEFTSLTSTPARSGEGLSHVWTGIVGETPDAVPFVGRIEGLEGQWICAGFNGHGMARIFHCAPGLVQLMTGSPWSETGLPECFQMSKERLARFEKKRANI